MNFDWPVRVYYEDTDAGGVVFYANYLKFMERARTELLRHYGFEQDQIRETHHVIFAVRQVQIDYHKPARFNQLLTVHTKITECKKASLVFHQSITPDGDDVCLCSANIKVASLNPTSFKPVAIPQIIREKISVD